jgi:hypothetical protein
MVRGRAQSVGFAARPVPAARRAVPRAGRGAPRGGPRIITMKSIAWIVLAPAAVLQGCGSAEGWRGRLGAGAGLSTLKARNGGQSETADGTQQSLRLEVARPIPYFSDVEVGLRAKGATRQIDDDFGPVDYVFDSGQFALLPTFRGHYGLSASSRFYGEVFAGYEYYWADERLGAATGSLNDGGVAYGAGIGVEFDVFRASALFVGLEWSRHDTQDVGINLSFEDYSGVVGLAFRF